MIKSIRPGFPLALAAAAVLAACGGGGDGDATPASTPVINPSNFVAAAQPLVQSVDGMDTVLRVLNLFVLQGPDRTPPQPLFACNAAGTQTLTSVLTDADRNGVISAGDTVRVTSNGCGNLTGSVDIRLNSYAVSAATAPYREQTTLTLTFNNFGSAGALLQGSAQMTVDFSETQGTANLTLAGASLLDAAGASTALTHVVQALISPAANTTAVTLSGKYTVGTNGDSTVTQQAPFVLDNAGLQAGGVARVDGPAGERLRLAATALNALQIQYFAPGNTGDTPTATAPQAY